jgi:ribonucleoside-diphosphate reductase alpha chain
MSDSLFGLPIVSQSEVASASGNVASWDSRAVNLITKRFLSGHHISLEEWLRRLSHRYASCYQGSDARKWQEIYFHLLAHRIFFPTSAALYNAIHGQGSLSGCMVLPVGETVEEICERTVPQVLAVLRNGIGVGLDLSVLCPRLGEDLNPSRAFPGPCEVFSSIALAADGLIAYSGLKRSAFMGSLTAAHPDLFEFISLKATRKLQNVNISIALDDAFVRALKSETLLPVSFGYDGQSRHLTQGDLTRMEERAVRRSVAAPDLVLRGTELHSRTARRVVGALRGSQLYFDPRAILDFASEHAHASGDPGILNFASINAHNPTHPNHALDPKSLGVGVLRATTPCGEQPLLPYEVCHLGSINLNAFISGARFDYASFKRSVPLIVRMMDDIVSLSDPGIKEVRQITEANRKIGIGFMGLADVLSQLGLPYDSEEGRSFAAHIAKTLQEVAREASAELASERGSFISWESSSYSRNGVAPRRHATLTTIAPTGHLSMLAGCSPAIEPYFKIVHLRNAAGKNIEVATHLKTKLRALGYSLDRWILDTRRNDSSYGFDGSLQGLTTTPASLPRKHWDALVQLKRIFPTAHEITPHDHLLMAHAIQPFIDNGISKTINLPHSATVSEVRSLFLRSIELGLKGVTVFRDGCLSTQALEKLPECAACGRIETLTKGECSGFYCDVALGGCGYDACSI